MDETENPLTYAQIPQPHLPKVWDYLGVVVTDPPEPEREIPIDAHCVVCGFKLGWRLVLGKRSSSKSTKLALLFLVFSIIGLTRLAEAEWRLVTRVVDGDTIIVGLEVG